MLKAIVTYYDETGKDPITVVMGSGEDLIATRDLHGKDYVDEDYGLVYRAWLAGKRQGSIEKNLTFEAWSSTVLEVEPRLSEKQIAQAVAMGTMTESEAEGARRVMGDGVEGESPTPRTE